MSAQAVAGQPLPMTRREFLYYIWGASMALFAAELGGVLFWYALPRFREGEFGGVITIDISEVPAPDSKPVNKAAGRLWLSNIGDATINDPRYAAAGGGTALGQPKQPGLKVIYQVCVHLGCLYKWVDDNNRFECPCHGSKYFLDGTTFSGPANRNLDTFEFELVDASGNVVAKPEVLEGVVQPLAIPANAAAIKINTAKKIKGTPNAPINRS
jgi:cytochrome b6-f complex iron-sulfur subunit